MFDLPNATVGIGRLTLRKDGWFSFDSGAVAGVLTTTALPVPPKPTGDMQLVVVVNLLSSVRGIVQVRCSPFLADNHP
jgi:hypothetical protein